MVIKFFVYINCNNRRGRCINELLIEVIETKTGYQRFIGIAYKNIKKAFFIGISFNENNKKNVLKNSQFRLFTQSTERKL